MVFICNHYTLNYMDSRNVRLNYTFFCVILAVISIYFPLFNVQKNTLTVFLNNVKLVQIRLHINFLLMHHFFSKALLLKEFLLSIENYCQTCPHLYMLTFFGICNKLCFFLLFTLGASLGAQFCIVNL